METFPLPKCSVHKDLTCDYLAFDHQARHVCTVCPLEGNRYVMSNQSFCALVMSSIAELQECESKAFRRHHQLAEIAAKAKAGYSQDDEQVLKRMLKLLEEENRTYKEQCLKVVSLKGHLMGVAKMISYFSGLKNGDLYEMKMNLSSQQGMRRFYKKCKDYAALIKKGVHGQFKKIEQRLSASQKQLANFESQSLIFKLKECLIAHKSQCTQSKQTKKQSLND